MSASDSKEERPGPLDGVRIIEFAGKGPCPMCGMLLADMGADVIRIERLAPEVDLKPVERRYRFMERGKRSISLDLKHPSGREVVMRLIESADALIEGFRPGVMERLGLGPQECMQRNPRVVYGRVTGWGQESPISGTAGHDINYIALTGALAAIGEGGGPPVVPLNLLGDFGGGATYLAMGVLSALLEARRSGRGQVVEAAMTDAVLSLMTAIYGARARGDWIEERGTNFLDGGAYYYGVYETRDAKHLAVGAIEPKFRRKLLEMLGIEARDLPDGMDRNSWRGLKDKVAKAIRGKTRAEWEEVFEGSDACVAPVLSMTEALRHPHNVARGSFVRVEEVDQPAPAPRFSRTPPKVKRPPAESGQHTEEILLQFGFLPEEVSRLEAEEVVRGKNIQKGRSSK